MELVIYFIVVFSLVIIVSVILWLFQNNDKTKEGEYVFSVHEIVTMGDYYKYYVKANNREEAFKKLVQWFYANEYYEFSRDDIRTDSGHILTPDRYDSFIVRGMPHWFGECISGKGSKEKLEKLESYCKKHNITLRKW